MNKTQKVASALSLAIFAPLSAFAAPVDLTALTSQVDLTTVSAGILSIGGLMIVVGITIFGVRKISKMFPK